MRICFLNVSGHRITLGPGMEGVQGIADRTFAATRTDQVSVVRRLVCAQHGRVVNGVKVLCGNSSKHEMLKPLSEANSGRVTDSGKEG